MIVDDGKEEEGRVLTWRGGNSGEDMVAGAGERVVPAAGDGEVEGSNLTCDSTTGTEELIVADWVELETVLGGFGV